MPAGAVELHARSASTAIGGADESTLFADRARRRPLLVEGTNVLAVEMHQSGGDQHGHQLRPRARSPSDSRRRHARPVPAARHARRASSCAGAPTWPTDSRVRLRHDAARQPRRRAPTTPTLTTEHVVTARRARRRRPATTTRSGRPPRSLAGGDAEHSFVTAPPPADAAADAGLGARRLGHRQRERRRRCATRT